MRVSWFSDVGRLRPKQDNAAHPLSCGAHPLSCGADPLSCCA